MKPGFVAAVVIWVMIVACFGGAMYVAMLDDPPCRESDVRLLCQQIDGVAGSELRCRRLQPCKEK